MIVLKILLYCSVSIIRAYRHGISVCACDFLASDVIEVLANYVLYFTMHNHSNNTSMFLCISCGQAIKWHAIQRRYRTVMYLYYFSVRQNCLPLVHTAKTVVCKGRLDKSSRFRFQ